MRAINSLFEIGTKSKTVILDSFNIAFAVSARLLQSPEEQVPVLLAIFR